MGASKLTISAWLLTLPLAVGAEITASSCSRADVNTAIGAASDGDTVLIPNGSCTWTSGVSTTKQIRIHAENYTPTSGGSSSRSVTITNNSSATLFSFTTGNDFHVGLSGIAIHEGTGDGGHLEVSGSGSKIALISDMYFEVKDRYWPVPWPVNWSAQGGVIWNTRFVSTIDEGGWGASLLVKSQPRVWTTASTMGALDTTGAINLYMEDCSCLNIGQFPDLDDHGRAVFRYNDLDGCSGVTHGFTSTWGGRHIEYYNNNFSVTTETRNHAGRYYWIRAGTALFTDNVANKASSTEYGGGNVSLFNIGDNTSPGTYPMARQPGYGHNGTTNVSDPIYSWNNTGAGASLYGFDNGWESIVVDDRDVFVDSGAKPNYTKYTYPHPAREALEGGPAPARANNRVTGAARPTGAARIQ
jgi:hypothetical protein